MYDIRKNLKAVLVVNVLALSLAATVYLASRQQLYVGKAAGAADTVGVETENGVNSSSIVVVSDDPNLVSGGKYIQFQFGGTPPITPSPSPSPTRIPSQTPTPTGVTTGKEYIYCENKTYTGFSDPVVVIGKQAVDQDPNVVKVIRGCTFKDAASGTNRPAVNLVSGKNILIENSTFENIRSNVPDLGRFAIGMGGDTAISDIVIRNNSFKYIGADGLQPGTQGPNIRNVLIEGNEFVGRDDVGENGVDIKGVYGPITIKNNSFHGFRPCESSKTKTPGTQDCTGSPGEGIVIHIGSSGYPPENITLENNKIWDNIYGLSVSGGNNITIRNNNFYSNIKFGLLITGGQVNPLSGNTYTNNGSGPQDNCKFQINYVLTCE